MSAAASELLEPFVRRPERAAVIADFDGTLAPIVDDPAKARPLPGAERVLGMLARRLGRVAVVSGRPVSFLRAALPIEGLTLVGQYGLERFEGGVVVTHPAAQANIGRIEAAAKEAQAEIPGLLVENKGVAVALHWRTSPEFGPQAVALGRRLAQTHGLAIQPGRLALELRAPVEIDKGTVAEELCLGRDAVLVAGDDHGDLAAFDAIARRREAGELRHGLLVAIRSPEAPPALLARADHHVDGPSGFLELLAGLAGQLGVGGT
jgi:trehalose 6-phosphate phosphatase